ncbi:hypothetical protein OAT18_01795 [Tenacibaculum sp.]|nr:hypothetical protein [Tenacibaculum sp.]
MKTLKTTLIIIITLFLTTSCTDLTEDLVTNDDKNKIENINFGAGGTTTNDTGGGDNDGDTDLE